MTQSHEDEGDLEAQAHGFAAELIETLTGALPLDDTTTLTVEVVEPSSPARITISTEPLVLTVNEEAALTLELDLRCEWDHQERFLAVQQSKFAVGTADTGAPLFRYDFIANAKSVPVAHLQMHAHRDEIVYHMVRGQRHRSKRRSKRVDHAPVGRYPRLADLHFPVGGRRMRPCVEDVLHFLIEEFAVDTKSDWRDVLETGRTRWRRLQIASMVRDSPSTAADALGRLGYTVLPPGSGHPPDREDRLRER